MRNFSAHIGEPDFERRLYRRDTLMVIAPVGHALEGKDTVTILDIAPFDHVGLQAGSSLQARVLEAARDANLEINMRVQVFGFDGVRRMVEAGLGIAVLPQGAVSHTWMTVTSSPWCSMSLGPTVHCT